MRSEKDFLGEVKVEDASVWGIHTERALANFGSSADHLGLYPSFIDAYLDVKMAAAEVNVQKKVIPANVGDAILHACKAIAEAENYYEFFPLNMIQGGAGTSTNMLFNEVIANFALAHMGKKKGDYEHCDPIKHVNASQSTNDTYPTAFKLALLYEMGSLEDVVRPLISRIRDKGDEWAAVLKMGRTEWQDAVPMSVQNEMTAFASALVDGWLRLKGTESRLLTSSVGGTAIGSGINAPEGFAEDFATALSKRTGYAFRVSEDLYAASWNAADFSMVSSALVDLAGSLSKMASDLRLLSASPIGEYELGAVQVGSSIMPGKVNPVMCEFMNSLYLEVSGKDFVVKRAVEGASLQLNPYVPTMAHSLLSAFSLLEQGVQLFAARCVESLRVNAAKCQAHLESSNGLSTYLGQKLGYAEASMLVKVAQTTGVSLALLAKERGVDLVGCLAK